MFRETVTTGISFPVCNFLHKLVEFFVRFCRFEPLDTRLEIVTLAVRETGVSRHDIGPVEGPRLNPLIP